MIELALAKGTKHPLPEIGSSPLRQRLWERMGEEAALLAKASPHAAALMRQTISAHDSLGAALVALLARKLGDDVISAASLADLLAAILKDNPAIADDAAKDIAAVHARDPACRLYLMPLAFFKGFQAISAWRFAHAFWESGDKALALHIQSRVSELWTMDLHPAARIGSGIMADHATGIVIGETAVVGDNVSMLHGVTLGGVSQEVSDRHPKVGDDVLLGAGACVLGNVEIGAGAKIAAGSVVLTHVPAGRTAAGVPARLVGFGGKRNSD